MQRNRLSKLTTFGYFFFNFPVVQYCKNIIADYCIHSQRQSFEELVSSNKDNLTPVVGMLGSQKHKAVQETFDPREVIAQSDQHPAIHTSRIQLVCPLSARDSL